MVNHIFDLFASLGANDDQLDFPLLYASAKQVRTTRLGPYTGLPYTSRRAGAPVLLCAVCTGQPAHCTTTPCTLLMCRIMSTNGQLPN